MKALLLGDLCPTACTNPLFEKGDIATLFTDTLSLFVGIDIGFVNLECALTHSKNAIAKFGPNLAAAPETAKILKDIGITVCGLSNNHFFDFGIEGAMDSLKHLEAANLLVTGFGKDYADSRKDLVIEQQGEKVAFITVCEHEYSYALEDRMGCRPWDEFDTIEDIRKAKAENDRVIVIYHGGKEHCRYPSPRLLRCCRAMARAGADVVLCQHSHCIGCYELYEGCHILYGQGNFHFESPGANRPATWNGALAVCYDTQSHQIDFCPTVNAGNGIALAKGDEKQEILSSFRQRNQTLADGTWRQHWHAFCENNRERYCKIIGEACREDSSERDNAVFGHFLDCEAHTDVWRELFPTWNQTNEK